MGDGRFSITAARERRAAKAAALSDLKEGRLSVTEAVSEPPTALNGVDLYDVLMACPLLGRSTVRVVCERASVWPHTPMSELAPAQRSSIVLALPQRVKAS